MRQCMRFAVCLILIGLISVPGLGQDEKKPGVKPALLVIDIQNQFLSMVPEEEKELALKMINYAILIFRHYNYPIIRIYHTDPRIGPASGTEAFEFPASVSVRQEDTQVIKNYPNGFKKTGLDAILKEKGCNTLFLCGLSAVGCVLATHHGAQDLDYTSFMIKMALMSHNSEYTGFVEQAFDAISLDAMNFILEQAQK